MRFLLDTHILLWAVTDTAKIAKNVAAIIADPDNDVFASAINFAELRIKQAIGKLELPAGFDETVGLTQFEILPFHSKHASWLSELPLHHRDPFDRMIIAQAVDEGMVVVTSDEMFRRYPILILAN